MEAFDFILTDFLHLGIDFICHSINYIFVKCFYVYCPMSDIV